jgi:hypothetical protein
MPRRRSQSQTRGLLLGTVAVLVGVVILAALSFASGKGKVDVSNLGDRVQWAGNADRLAKRVAKDGPFILPDASPNRDRVVYLQHLGGNDDKGWYTILAITDGCAVQWTGSAFQECDGTTHPPDGTGLTRYKTYVDRNGVYVDLRTTVP